VPSHWGASPDERFARRALIEGGAVYVTDQYTREHLNVTLQSEHIAERYEAGSSGDRIVYSQYYFGSPVRERQHRRSCADLADVYDDAPRTTENVLHPGRPTNSPARRDHRHRGVRARAVADRSCGRTRHAHHAPRRHRKPQAVNASEGWGNDRVVVFEDGWERSVAWVTRWDTAADADEFAAAARTLGNETDTEAFRTTRLDEETVVVFAGTESFVETASASGNVTISA